MMQITEDTPPDMLTGAMDLTVYLPNGRTVKMSVKRSMPMLDLLMHITTNHHLQLSEHTLEVLSMAPSNDHSERLLPFKTNTPVGTLDTQHVRVVPKTKSIPKPKPMAPEPFEKTFRLKVHLPRNQLYVTRVSRNVLLEDIMNKVCEEKNLDSKKYELKHPGNLDEVLDPKLTLNDYKITEVYLMVKGTVNLNQAFSSTDIMVLRKEEERKRLQAKTGGGVFGLIFGRGKSNMSSGSLSSENRSISPSHSDDSRSVTPPAITQEIITPPKPQEVEKPKPPQRKRRPAPKPPQSSEGSRKNSETKPPSNISDSSDVQLRKVDNSLTICHSRNSSDSSGYHEASILSDNCNTSLPRRPQSAYVNSVENLPKQLSQSTSNLSKMSSHSKSTSSLAFPGRKKKAAPPPPPVLKSSTSATNLVSPSPVDASQNPASLPPTESLVSTNFTQPTPLDSLASNLSLIDNNSVPETPKTPQEPKEIITDDKQETDEHIEAKLEENSEIVIKDIEEPVVESVEEKEEIANIEIDETDKSSDIKDVDWQYKLPPPPKGFRDSSPTNFTDVSNYDAVTVKTDDSVITSPELFEKLKVLEDNQSEKETVVSEASAEKPLMNTLSLENLEKRKSLVYNRELATSLKMNDNVKNETFSSSLSTFESTYEEVRRSSLQKQYPEESRNTVKRSTSTLPNFKITTYDPKKNIKVFEDETIRSNTESANNIKRTNYKDENIQTSNLSKTYVGRSMENISFRKNSWGNQSDDDKSKSRDNYSIFRPQNSTLAKNKFGPSSSVFRSESFSTDQSWTPSKPVSRSKSQLTLNKYKEDKPTYQSLDPVTKSNSLLDVSGLQSVGVMKLIQNKLKTPTSSVENINQQEKPSPKPVNTITREKEEVKTYQYRGPPSINMGTWSERPKAPVNVKNDGDYKINNVSSKLIVNTTNNNITSNNRIEVNNSTKVNTSFSNTGGVNVRVGGFVQPEPRNVTIKVNGTEPISTETSGNVVIKIGSSNPTVKTIDSQRFISHTTAVGYRKPERPHSIAVDSDFDTSRVPVVRSVELKKPYKDIANNNTSVTQIYQGNTFRSNTLNRHMHTSTEPLSILKKNMYRSTEALSQTPSNNNNTETKPVSRLNSFTSNVQPVIRGFQTNNINVANNRYSWSPQTIAPTSPKEETTFTTNKHVPFSQSNLRRTDSNKLIHTEQEKNSFNFKDKLKRTDSRLISDQENGVDSKENTFQKVNLNNHKNTFNSVKKPDIIQPPPPPQMPKIDTSKKIKQNDPVANPREQLFSEIINFGGKKGLKSIKG